MKKDLYIFRHGETDYNLEHRWQGCGLDAVLNENGEEQARKLAEKVLSLGMTVLYCSPLVRAVQTANKIACRSATELPIIILQDLREGDFGEVEGMTFDEVRARFGDTFVENVCWPSFDNWDIHFPGGESKREIFGRVLHCLNRIVCKKDSIIGVVCHAGVLSALKCGLELKKTPNENCSVLHLQYDSETKKFVQIFD